MHPQTIPMSPIATLYTPFKEKFGAPRQSLMIPEAKAILKLSPEYPRETLNHLETFSHLWIVFCFDRHLEKPWHPTIRPPRVDAPRKVGVFASRSPHRPNPIGLSAVKLDSINFEESKNIRHEKGIEIYLSGVDFLDGTLVFDIKPYIPYTDSILEANSGWIKSEIPSFDVLFSETATSIIREHEKNEAPHFEKLLIEVLRWDPRPTSQKRAFPIQSKEFEGMQFGFNLYGYDIKWVIHQNAILVTDLIKIPKLN